jgi:outer membrane protein assembly factor BamB
MPRSLIVILWFVATACGGAPPPISGQPPAEHAARQFADNKCAPYAPSDISVARTHRSPFVGPKRPTITWVVPLGNTPFGVVADSAGTAFVATNDGVVAFDRDGTQRWSHVATTEPPTLAAVADDGAIYLQVVSASFIGNYDVFHGGVQRIDNCGNTQWMVPAPPQNFGTPVINNGTVYFAGHDRTGPENVFAVQPNGIVAWQYLVPHDDTVTSSLAVDPSGAVYFGTALGKVVAIDPSGHERWRVQLAPDIVFGITLATDGTVYVASGNGTLYALEPREGSTQWTYTLGPPAAYKPPALGSDGTLYEISTELLAIHPNGALAWSKKFDAPLVDRPLVGRDGTIYVGSYEADGVGRVFAVDPKAGDIEWQYYTEAVHSLALGADAQLYVQTAHKLYALGECTTDNCGDEATAGLKPEEPPHVTAPVTYKPLPKHAQAHAGFTVYPDCMAATTAIVTTEGDDFEWYTVRDPSPKAKLARDHFRGGPIGASGLRVHSNGFGVSCVEPRGAFAIFVVPGQDVAAAAKRIGEWLVAKHLRGEVDIVIESEPHLL